VSRKEDEVTPLSESEIASRLAGIPGWQRRGSEITRTFAFADFKGSMVFVNRVAGLAEAMDHHPDIDIRYSKVTLTLTTHDASGLTARDFALAEAIGA
jgi:4a-hydroxytetrahydrobiopterin dehydratase